MQWHRGFMPCSGCKDSSTVARSPKMARWLTVQVPLAESQQFRQSQLKQLCLLIRHATFSPLKQQSILSFLPVDFEYTCAMPKEGRLTQNLIYGSGRPEKGRSFGSQDALAGGIQQLPPAIDQWRGQRFRIGIQLFQLLGYLLDFTLVLFRREQASI